MDSVLELYFFFGGSELLAPFLEGLSAFAGMLAPADRFSTSSILDFSLTSGVYQDIRLFAELMNLDSNLAAELSSSPGETYS